MSPLQTNSMLFHPVSTSSNDSIKTFLPFKPIQAGCITITNSMYGLLLLFSRVRRSIHGLVSATYEQDTGKFLIDWIEPVKPSDISDAYPDAQDFRTRKDKLEGKGKTVIGEFRTEDTMNLSDRDRQRMKYHFLTNKHHVQLIASIRAVSAFIYDGTEYVKFQLKPFPTIRY